MPRTISTFSCDIAAQYPAGSRAGMSVLLRQPCGFESLAAVEEDSDALDPAVDEVPDVRARNVAAEVYAAHPPAHVETRASPPPRSPATSPAQYPAGSGVGVRGDQPGGPQRAIRGDQPDGRSGPSR